MVLMNHDDYVQEALNQLQDEKVYKKIETDPTMATKKEIDAILTEAIVMSLPLV